MGFLVFPTAAVRASYLDGERAASQEAGADPAWLDQAAADFAGFVGRLSAPPVDGTCRSPSSGTSTDPPTSAQS